MAKPSFQPNPRVQQIFEDLEKYLDFCKDYGYKFDESDLYNQKNYVYRQYIKFSTGKQVKDNWEDLIDR
jgi:hypothetical protein